MRLNNLLTWIYRSIIFIIFTTQISAQYANTISGRIIDSETGQPIIGVNVYLSGTLFGTTTDEIGKYKINSIPPGSHELVVSMIGYLSKNTTALIKQNSNLVFDFILIPRLYDFGIVEVTEERPDKWLRNLKIFKEKFLGNSPFAEMCEIKNEEVINFSYDSNGRLVAEANEPLIIFNYALGFELNCLLTHFVYDSGRGILQFKVAPSFILMEKESNFQADQWNVNRRDAYLGSQPHFLNCLKNDSTFEAGYRLSLSSEVFGRSRSRPVGLSDTLITPGYYSGEYNLDFEGFLLVEYHDEILYEFQNSAMKLLYPIVTIDEYGYPLIPNAIQSAGYWSTLGVADMLPKYFDVENY